jgi:DNA-binding FadR family transcriptional regulator
MLLIIIPDLIKVIIENDICDVRRSSSSMVEHHNILDAIELGDPAAAEQAMKIHLQIIMDKRSIFIKK